MWETVYKKKKGKLGKHIQVVHENIRFNCEHCDKNYSIQGSLKKHIIRDHLGDD